MPWLSNKTTATASAFAAGLPAVAESLGAAGTAWEAFWSDGAFVDLATSTDDPAAFELERRIVLSRRVLLCGIPCDPERVLSSP